MSPYAFALAWVAHGVVLGLVSLALPRMCRASDPRRLAWWWGGAAWAVVVSPLLPLLSPGPPPPSAGAVITFVESTSVALTAAMPVAHAPSPVLVLGVVWAVGVAGRLAFLAVGRRRLARMVAGASEVTDDPALLRARDLVPSGWRYPLAPSPVRVLAATGATPCAFGWRAPCVLVPHSLRHRPAPERVAVYLHELLHVARGDVHRTSGDEVVRLLCWWQPAVWWMLARLRLARELEVDADVVARTGNTRGYVEALIWCSTLEPSLSYGLRAGGSRHALVRRVALMCTNTGGGEMTRTRRWLTNGGMTLAAAAVAATLGIVAPLRAAAPGTSGQDEAGPLERKAVLPTLDAPAPRRLANVEPVWESPFGFRLRVHLVLDAAGRVAEARIPQGVPAGVATGDLRDAWLDARRAVLHAVRQWQFDAPAAAPMLLLTDVVVGTADRTAPQPLRVGGTIGPPRKIVDGPPVYPDAAKEAGVSGVVIIEATIDPEGRVQDARVVRSIPLLDAAAVDAVKQWRYAPTLLNGEPVPVIMTVTINFTLQ